MMPRGPFEEGDEERGVMRGEIAVKKKRNETGCFG